MPLSLIFNCYCLSAFVVFLFRWFHEEDEAKAYLENLALRKWIHFSQGRERCWGMHS